ncbi:uroporphyrinogen-III C-methyltransferase [Paenibacillus sp. MBLB4367]|uniref:uroporphyrinogen-III C-methyltransferase n=1 Tax=Paenibacillus sp. MBLB4367 TaxID=3384767 RepID=UPI0039080943
MANGTGIVYLVGAGPGDPKLISLRGLEAIRKADVVVYDRLASPQLLKHMKDGAEKIFVGKLPDKHMLKQSEINQLLVDLAVQGKTVTRLKGGDPCVFGRVGEEAELLADNRIRFEIVPGITSAIAVPAYAGIPVTHRDFTSSFTIVTGHEYNNKTYSDIDYAKLASATGTIIFLMGVANIANIRDQLLRCGKPADLPVALIRWGTWMEQETLVGTLETIVEQVREANFQSPAVIIVGEVVRLREKLAWFEHKPLFGKRIMVTRSRSQASELAERIDELGGEAVEFPVVQMRQPIDPATLQKLDDALAHLDRYDWVIFTSVNGVEYFYRRLKELRIDVRQMHKARIAAVGPKTAESLLERGIIAESLPSKFQADSLFEALEPMLAAGQRVLLPRADIAAKWLPGKLREVGLDVTEADVYETVLSEAEEVGEIIAMLEAGSIHAVTFTSSSTVTNLLAILAKKGVERPQELLAGLTLACIGPITAETARNAGLTVQAVAEEATIESLVQALAAAPLPVKKSAGAEGRTDE